MGGLPATACTYWDYTEAEWFRVYVDSEGERLVLRDDFDGTSLVLSGTDGSVSGHVDVRLTFMPETGGVTQTWEVPAALGACFQNPDSPGSAISLSRTGFGSTETGPQWIGRAPSWHVRRGRNWIL